MDRWHEPYMPADELVKEIVDAIEFYRRNGFTVVPSSEKDRLLRTYWSIPARQIETSVVLANRRWIEA